MPPARDSPDQARLASVQGNNDLGRNAPYTFDLLKSLGNQTQPGNVVQSSDDGEIADPEDFVRPIKPCRRQIADHQIVLLLNEAKESIERSHGQLNRSPPVSPLCQPVVNPPP